MLKLLVLCFTIFSLISAIHCTPTAVKRGKPSPGFVARGQPSPVLAARNKPSPVLAARSKPSPVLAARSKPSPVLAARSKPSPVLVARNKPSPVLVARGQPSPRSEGLVARGHCDFQCPYESMTGKALSKLSTDSGRLYCRYDVEETDDKDFCMYKRNTGELVSSSSLAECDDQAVFHCPGTKSSQEEMKWVPEQPQDSRSVNLPQFVKARSMARRAADADAV